MAIPVSTVVNVSITIGAKFPSRKGFGILNLVTMETGVISLAERIRSYDNIDGVVADWPATSEVVKAATAYFSQQPKPTAFTVSVRFEDDQAGQLRGGAVSDHTLFKAISDASFKLTIDGATAEDITGVDFSATSNMDEVATELQVAIRAIASGGFIDATCEYDGSRFLINSGTTGVASTVAFMQSTDPVVGTDISSLLEMRQGQGTTTSGITGETITESLSAIENVNTNWYGLIFTKEVRDGYTANGENAVEAAADWCEARVKMFGNTSNDVDVLDSVTDTDIMSVLKAKSLSSTISTFSSYPDQYPSASLLGRAFTVNFSQPDSTITLKFKQLPGITVENLLQNQKSVLDSKNGNALIKVGDSIMFAESFMANGTFLDETHGVDWLENAIQTNIFGYMLTKDSKVPYTDAGVAALEQQLIKALDEARLNGLIAPGETIDGVFLPNGYETVTIPVADVNQSDKEARHYAGLSFTALGAGAIHGVQTNGTFER